MTRSSTSLLAALLFTFTLMGCSESPETIDEPVNTSAVDAEQLVQAAQEPTKTEPSRWIEGTHYTIVADNTSAEKEVVEYFSYWCPHCYQFEGVANIIKTNLTDDVGFRKVHVNFMGFTSQEIQEAATKAMLIGRALNQEQLINTAIFTHLHDRRLKIEGISDLKNLLAAYDISEDDFENTMNTEQFSDAFAKNNGDIQQFRDTLTGVPTLIVNGKYKTQFTGDMTLEDVPVLINWLSQLK